MGSVVFDKEYRNHDQFRIDYPYYGLFGSARVIRSIKGQEVVFNCTLLNGNIITIKKSTSHEKWIDTELNTETPLSAIIGIAIEDFLK